MSAPLSFTIPSVHQQIELACRLYHPSHKRMKGSCKRGAIVAHPYASLGGSYNDPAVLTAVSALVEEGFVVGTFNFRGAQPSTGTTSWSGKAEALDYVSFVGFFIHYMKQLRGRYTRSRTTSLPAPPRPSSQLSLTNAGQTFVNKIKSFTQPAVTTMHIVLAGYSYGSVMLSNLPPMQDMIDRFAHAVPTSPESRIVAIASRMAAHANASTLSRETAEMYRNASATVSAPELRTHPKVYRARKLVGGGFKRTLRTRSTESAEKWVGQVQKQSQPHHSTQNTTTKVMYLFISPVLGKIKRFLHWSSEPYEDYRTRPCLVVCGDHDHFTSVKAVHKWAYSPTMQVRVLDASHFWHEGASASALKTTIAEWARLNC